MIEGMLARLCDHVKAATRESGQGWKRDVQREDAVSEPLSYTLAATLTAVTWRQCAPAPS